MAGHTKVKFVFVKKDLYKFEEGKLVEHYEVYLRPIKWNGARIHVADIYSYPSTSKPHWYFIITAGGQNLSGKHDRQKNSYKELSACKAAVRDCFDHRHRRPTFKEAK